MDSSVYPILVLVAAAWVVVLAVYLSKRARGASANEPVSVRYLDGEWKGAIRDGETVAAQAAVLKPPTWVDWLLSSSLPRGRSTPYQLACTSRGALLIAHRDRGGGLSAVERHDGSAVSIDRAEPERAGSPYVTVDLMVHSKRRSFFCVPAPFMSDLRRTLGR